MHYDIVRALRDGAGMPNDVAVPLARHIARALARRLGGLYIHKTEMRAERDKAILAKFNGSNHKALAHEFSVSLKTVYNVIARAAVNHNTPQVL